MKDSEAKKILQENIDFIKNLSVPEYTLYRKWTHMNTDEMVKWMNNNRKEINRVKNDIWFPDNYNDFKDLNIDVIPADDSNKLLKWRILRELTHSAPWHSSPGRMARFIIVHKEKQRNMLGVEEDKWKYLGVISLGSDFIGVGGRDEVIGWTQDDRKKHGMLKHTAMGSSISPTQPLGYNYLGGKLIALMVCSNKVGNFWNSKYEEKLVGITTTSLYGGFSQYNHLKYWKKCKSSEGKIKIEPTEDIYEILKEWVKRNYPENYPYNPKNGNMSHPKQRLVTFLFKHLDIDVPYSYFKRGVYWCPLYTNSEKFLCREDNELLEKRFDNSISTLSELWKEKYAMKRINNLRNDGRVNNNTLFYDDLIDKDWNETKDKYLYNIGR